VSATGCDRNSHNVDIARGLPVTQICLAEPGFRDKALEPLFNYT